MNRETHAVKTPPRFWVRDVLFERWLGCTGRSRDGAGVERPAVVESVGHLLAVSAEDERREGVLPETGHTAELFHFVLERFALAAVKTAILRFIWQQAYPGQLEARGSSGMRVESAPHLAEGGESGHHEFLSLSLAGGVSYGVHEGVLAALLRRSHPGRRGEAAQLALHGQLDDRPEVARARVDLDALELAHVLLRQKGQLVGRPRKIVRPGTGSCTYVRGRRREAKKNEEYGWRGEARSPASADNASLFLIAEQVEQEQLDGVHDGVIGQQGHSSAAGRKVREERHEIDWV